MSDELNREARIAAAEADQDRRHAEGGSVEERVARLKQLGDQIAEDPDAEPPQ